MTIKLKPSVKTPCGCPHYWEAIERIHGCERAFVELDKEKEALRQRVKELEKCCCKRGARLQKLFGWVKGKHSAEHFIQCFPEASNWFDEDGVPL